MAWTFSGTFLDGLAADRVLIGTGEPEPLPGRYALAGLVDAHAHPTVARDEHGPARGGAWTPTLCAVLGQRDSDDPVVRARVGELRERLRDHLPYAAAQGVRILAGSDVVGTIAEEIALLADHGLTVEQAIAAAGSLARDFLGIRPARDLVTYDDDPRDDPGVLRRPAAVVVRGVRVR